MKRALGSSKSALPNRDDLPRADLLRDAVSQSGGSWVRVRSASMAPAIQEGESVWVTALRGGRPRMGEILLVEGPTGPTPPTLHRCLYVRGRGEKTRVRTKGDAARALDPLVPLEKIIGRAVRARSENGERLLGRGAALLAWSRSIAGVAMGVLKDRRVLFKTAVIPSRRRGTFESQAQVPKIPRFARNDTHLRDTLSAPGEAAITTIRRERGRLACFAVEITLPQEIEPALLCRWLRPDENVTPPVKAAIGLDPALDHSDPFLVRVTRERGDSFGSSAFRLEKQGGKWRLRVAPAEGTTNAPCPNALENALRLLLLLLCAESEDAVLLHAAAVAFEGTAGGTAGAWVAPGASGTGKTTLSRLLKKEGFNILSDDLVVVRRAGQNWEVWGTPFSGDGQDIPKTGAPAPLAGWLLLEKGPAHRLSNGSAARLAAALAAAAQRPPLERENSAGGVLDRAMELTGAAPLRTLSFAPVEGLGPYLLNGLQKNVPNAGAHP